MQLNLETEELRQMALMIFGDKISAMEQRIAELEALCTAKDIRIEELERAVDERDTKIAAQQNQVMDLTMKMNETTLTTWALKQFLVLSKQKASVYVHSVDNNMRAQLGQFMFQSLPENAPPILVDYVRKVTQPESPEPMVTNNHYVTMTGDEATYNENPQE